MLSKNDLLKHCLTKTGTFKSSVGEIKLRQLSIAETEQITKIQSDPEKNMIDIIKYTLKCSMVEPEFFTDEEFDNLSGQGMGLLYEIYNEVPTIGMSEKEKEEYKKRIEEYLKTKKDKTEEDVEGK